MSTQSITAKRFTPVKEGILVTGVVAAVIGGLFLAEGLLGYFYNYSMFLEGLDHIIEIYSGLAVVIVGAAAAIYEIVRR